MSFRTVGMTNLGLCHLYLAVSKTAFFFIRMTSKREEFSLYRTLSKQAAGNSSSEKPLTNVC